MFLKSVYFFPLILTPFFPISFVFCEAAISTQDVLFMNYLVKQRLHWNTHLISPHQNEHNLDVKSKWLFLHIPLLILAIKTKKDLYYF